jgi:4-hydroxy-tetrahydrodipicolinate synthase
MIKKDNTRGDMSMKTLGETFGKIIIPMVTPFKENGDVNYDEAEKLTDYLIEKKYCDSIVVAGTTGEFNTLEYDERIELFRVVKNTAAGRIPLMAGTGAGSTREAIKFSQAAEQIGYDCVMVVNPYYCKPTQEGVYNHFSSIAATVDVPVMLYNIPIFSGINIEPCTVHRLSKIKNICGIKDEAGINPVQMTDYRLVVPEDFTIYNGDDIMVLCGLAQGASGVVSGLSHLVGDQMRTMINHFLAGEIELARKYHMNFHPFLRFMGANNRVNPIPILRAAIEMAGHPIGRARLPLDEATDEEKRLLKKYLQRLGAI